MQTCKQDRRIVLILLCAFMAVSVLAVAFSAGTVSAEGTGPDEVTVGENTYFLIDNVYYFITSDEESEEEVAVAGIKDAGSSSDVFVTGAFEYDGIT